MIFRKEERKVYCPRGGQPRPAGFVLSLAALVGMSVWGINLLTQQPDGPAAIVVEGTRLEVAAPDVPDRRPVRLQERMRTDDAPPSLTGVITDTGQTGLPLEKVVGEWGLSNGIKRKIDVRPDGTATMHVRLDLLGSLLYGQEMTLELSWNVKDDVMSHSIISGEPKRNVDRMIRDYGDSRHYRIVELNDDILLLEDFEESPTTYRWVRPEQGEARRTGPTD